MIEKYKVISLNGEKRLILFLNLNYEFGGKGKNKKQLKQIIRNYIRDNKIAFNKGMIIFVVGGVMIGNLFFNNEQFKDYKPVSNDYGYVSQMIVKKLEEFNDIDKNYESGLTDEKLDNVTDKKTVQEVNSKKIINNSNNNNNGNQVSNEQKVNTNQGSSNVSSETPDKKNEVVSTQAEDKEVKDDNIYVNLRKKDGSIVKIELEEYVVGVVGAEMPALFNIEALKSQAIIARTYAFKATMKGNILKDNESNQSYKTDSELRSMWGGNYNTYYNKIKSAVSGTKGVVLTYNGSYIEAVYHSTSNGMTESSVNVWGNYYPYLVNVKSTYDNSNVSFEVKKELSYQEISDKLGFEVNKETVYEIKSKTSGNRVETIVIGNVAYKGIDFRNILGLRSADFDIESVDTGIIFTTRGYGHGVGLSQYGANGMAKNGYNYEQILKHYYPGVSLSKV